jgi:hypothetical protein
LESGEFERPPLAGDTSITIEQTQTANFVLFVQLPTDDASDGITMGYQRTGSNTPAIEFTLPGIDSPLPAFEVESIDAPSQATEEEPYPISITIRNTGDPGTFRGVFEYEDDGGWIMLYTADNPVIERTVDAGESTEIVITNESGLSGEFRYRLAPFTGQTWTTTFS